MKKIRYKVEVDYGNSVVTEVVRTQEVEDNFDVDRFVKSIETRLSTEASIARLKVLSDKAQARARKVQSKKRKRWLDG